MREEWKNIPGFKYHEVSNHGRVRKKVALSRPFYYKRPADANGHLTIQLSYKGIPERLRVSRLVGQAFCPDFRPSLRPLYLDGNKTNCRSDNLKWVPLSQVTKAPYSRNPKPTNQKEPIQCQQD